MTHSRFFRFLLIPVLILLIFAPVTPPVPSTLWASLPLAFAADTSGVSLYRAAGLGGSLAFQEHGASWRREHRGAISRRKRIAVDRNG
jgi:hypothetical protein